MTEYYVGVYSLGAWQPWGQPPMVWLDAHGACVAAAQVKAALARATNYPYRVAVCTADRGVYTCEYELE